MTLVLVTAAYLTATLSGILGMAGGATLLGVMAIVMDPAEAVPIHAVVQLVSNSTRTFAQRRHVRWRLFAIVAVAALPMPMVGLWLLQGLDATTVRAIMGAVVLYSVWVPKWGLRKLSDRAAFAVAGIVGGTFGVVVGMVGPLLAPFFLRGGFHKRELIGTKAVCQMFFHLLKLAAFAGLYPALLTAQAPTFSFAAHAGLIVPMALATIAGTYTGDWLLGKVSEDSFVRLYKSVLTVLAVRLVIAGLL